MRVLIVFAHPKRDSFCGSILSATVDELSAAGHETDVLDLYSDDFCPVMPRSEWDCYEELNSAFVQPYVDQIHRADGLIWIFPTWNYGFPAILKGYIDRVWKPKVTFRIDQYRNLRFDTLDNLRFFIVVTTYGANWIASALVGNPCKRAVVCGLKRHIPPSSKFAWLALYGLDKPSATKLDRFVDRVRKTVHEVTSCIAASTPIAE
jgi:NAD(P)H dehydrogenase (quinone)